MNDTRRRVAAIVGPTAVGKTKLAALVAETLGCEIVSVDSMQIYRGMDIGTDKANARLRAQIPHHLLDLKSPSEELSVAEYRDLARSAIAGISERGKLPLLVGGSGLYFRAIVDDLRFPPTSTAVRERLSEECAAIGVEALHERLAELDPHAALKIQPANARRIIRALEVIELTGLPFSSNNSWGDHESRYKLAVVGLRRDREELFSLITERVEEMFERGLKEEVLSLPDLSVTARQALGYKQILDAPDSDMEVLKAEIARATKRFARRQESWFRSDPRIEWFDADEPDLPARLGDLFRARLWASS